MSAERKPVSGAGGRKRLPTPRQALPLREECRTGIFRRIESCFPGGIKCFHTIFPEEELDN